MSALDNREIGWDEEISEERQDYEPLSPGVYTFKVHSMERARFAGSEKMGPCNMASLDLVVEDAEGKERHVFDSLYLHKKAEWKLSQFFLCIGQKKTGVPLTPNWNEVPCSQGKVELVINSYTDKNGNPKKNNRVSKYLPYEPKKFTAGSF